MLKSREEQEQEQEQELLAGILTEEKLLEQYNIESLAELESLALVIDTSEHTIAHLAEKLQRLRYLQLDGSKIHSVRDLGTGLTNLSYLSLSNCNLSEVDGIGVLSGLRELHVADNMIEDLTPLAMHACLEVLNVRNNNILDVSALEMASTCEKLRALDLRGNPISRISNFRTLVVQLIPNLSNLNGDALDATDKSPAAKQASHQAVLQNAIAEIEMQREEMEEEQRMEALLLQDAAVVTVEPDWDRRTPLALHSPMVRSHQPHAEDFVFGQNDGSELTHGSTVVLAGNMSFAMRRRRAEMARTARAASNADPKPTANAQSESNLLKEIDDALEQVASGLPGDVQGSEWVHEGDITSSVLPITPKSTNSASVLRRRRSRATSPPEQRPSSAFARQPSSRRPSTAELSAGSRPSTASSSQCNSESAPLPRSKYSFFSIDSTASAPFMVSISEEHLEQVRALQRQPVIPQRISDSEQGDSDDTEEDEDDVVAITHRARRERSLQLQQAEASPRLMRNHPRLWQEMTERCQNLGDGNQLSANQQPSPRWARRTSHSSVATSTDADDDEHERNSTSAKVSRILGFDLRDSLAAIDEWIAQASESDDSNASPRTQEVCDVAPPLKSPTLPSTPKRPHPPRSANPQAPPGPEQAANDDDDTIPQNELKSALKQSDTTLISMLRRLPKHLRSKQAMRSYFNGVSEQRMQLILNQAFQKTPEGSVRVQKYMALLDGVLV